MKTNNKRDKKENNNIQEKDITLKTKNKNKE